MKVESLLTVSAMLLMVGAAFACASAATGGIVRGTAMYRERIALPPGAVLEVSLRDVSKQDVYAVELGSVRIEDPGSPPFEFEIPYDPEAINEGFTYSVRATIRADGKLLFTTDTHYPVLTRGAGDEVDLMMRAVAARREKQGATLGTLPASFEGELPCADCPGIHYRLDLFSDRVFFLRTTYLGRGAGAISDSVGEWVLARDEERLTLFTGKRAPVFFRVVNTDTLRKLDIEGHEIDSPLNYDLRRKEGLRPLEVRLMMRGMYSYLADAAVFKDCLSGRRFQVAQESDNLALERAYLEARREPGEELMVSLRGRIAERPAMEGDAMVLTVVPERFLGVWPGETCGARGTVSELENNYWKLTRLGDQPVVLAENQREPHLVLRSEDGRVSGFGGCNSFTGGYTIERESIAFGHIAKTAMACLYGEDVEMAFLAALAEASTFHLMSHHLEIFDGAGNMVARFEARELE